MTSEIGLAGVEPPGLGWPLVELHAIGDGSGVASAIARVLVRRALTIQGVIRVGETCESLAVTG